MDWNASVGLFEFANGKVYAFGDNMGRGGQVLTSGLGLKLQEKLQEVSDGQGWAEISIEALYQFAPDYMFVTVYTANGEPSKDVEEMKKTSVWKNLPAVQNNSVIELPFEQVYYYDPIAVLQQLKIVTDSIINTMNNIVLIRAKHPLTAQHTRRCFLIPNRFIHSRGLAR